MAAFPERSSFVLQISSSTLSKVEEHRLGDDIQGCEGNNIQKSHKSTVL